MKSGRSAAGAQAAMSHTSSLAGNSRLSDHVLGMAGAVPAYDFFQLLELTQTLASDQLPPPPGRMAIITHTGGGGVVTCDLMEKQGLPLAEFSAKTTEALADMFPDWASVKNPLDMFPVFGKMDRSDANTQAALTIIEDPGVDIVLLHFVAGRKGNELDLELLKQSCQGQGKVPGRLDHRGRRGCKGASGPGQRRGPALLSRPLPGRGMSVRGRDLGGKPK